MMSAAARTKATVASGPRCSACGVRYSDADWIALRVSERLAPTEVRRLVLDWPDELCIEVRCCRHCGHPTAAKRIA